LPPERYFLGVTRRDQHAFTFLLRSKQKIPQVAQKTFPNTINFLAGEGVCFTHTPSITYHRYKTSWRYELMDALRNAAGILGTGARLSSDITLLAYIFMIVPGMIIGFGFARRKMFVPHHKMVMTSIVIINWILIGLVMYLSYSQFVAPSVPEKLGSDPIILTPFVHLLLGLSAQVMGTILVLRMWLEKVLPKWMLFEPIKFWMRLTLVLWLLAAIMGAVTYVTWYGMPFSRPANQQPASISGTPEATRDAASPAGTLDPAATPEATRDAASPAGTPDPAAIPEATRDAAPPAGTPEAAPVATPEATREVSMVQTPESGEDSSGRGRGGSDNSGKGSGN
jgi:uncharacterized membrane protein YozB (DUF420 family)